MPLGASLLPTKSFLTYKMRSGEKVSKPALTLTIVIWGAPFSLLTYRKTVFACYQQADEFPKFITVRMAYFL